MKMGNNMVLNNLEVLKEYERAHEGAPRKFEYLKAIKGVTNHEHNGYKVVEILQGDGSKCVIAYKEGTSDMRIFSINTVGATTQLRPRYVGYKRCINRNNTLININELIYQADRITNNLPVELGSYNHHLPSAFIGIGNQREIFSVKTGDICSFEQNNIHWGLCSRVYKDTGLMCSFKSYTKAFELLSIKTITEQDVKKYNHIDRGWYLEILE